MLGYHTSLCVITAQHVVRGWPVERLHIYPSDRAKRRLPLTRGYTLPIKDGDDADLAIIKVDVAAVRSRDSRSSNLIQIPKVPAAWLPHRSSATFFCFGFPIGPMAVDYPALSLSSRQYMLTGTYLGPSVHSG